MVENLLELRVRRALQERGLAQRSFAALGADLADDPLEILPGLAQKR